MSSLLSKIPRLQFFRDSTAKNNGHVGRDGELTIDEEAATLRLHNGSKAGGHVVGQSKLDVYAGSNIDLNFRTYKAFKVTLSGTATVTFSGRQAHILNETLVNFKGLNNTSVVWPTELRWLHPNGTFVASAADTTIDLTGDDWLVFWTYTAEGTIHAKIIR